MVVADPQNITRAWRLTHMHLSKDSQAERGCSGTRRVLIVEYVTIDLLFSG